jgi:hypothetical protein
MIFFQLNQCRAWQSRGTTPSSHQVNSLSPVYKNSGASDFCHVRLILPGCPSNFARLSNRFRDRNFPISLSDFMQCDVHQWDAYKNRTDGLAKSVVQPKSH